MNSDRIRGFIRIPIAQELANQWACSGSCQTLRSDDPSHQRDPLIRMKKFSSAQTLKIHMGDPIFSPDGEFMWTGSEWIPAPPGKEHRETNVDVVQSQKQEESRSKSYAD